ncbi:MAG: flagellar biosynthetic protein FliO [Chitinispirillia bacterium]|jgi:flagellar biogenesis protein FliO
MPKALLFLSIFLTSVTAFLLFPPEIYGQNNITEKFDITKVQKAIREDLDDPNSIKNGIKNDNVKQESDSYFFVTLKIMMYLIIITMVIVFGIWIIKKMGLYGTSRIGGGSMDLLETLPIGQNRSVVLLRIMDSVMVVAQTAQKITLLDKIEGEKAVELIASTKGGTSIVRFKDHFNNFMQKIRK